MKAFKTRSSAKTKNTLTFENYNDVTKIVKASRSDHA